MKGTEYYVRKAMRHGEDDDPDHEVGDLQEYFRIAHHLLTDEQREQFDREAAEV